MKRSCFLFAICFLTFIVAPGCGGDTKPEEDVTSDVVGTDDGTPDVSEDVQTDTPTCESQCDGKACGPDGCGGICGLCGPGATCTAQGSCEQDIVGTVAYGEECFVSPECADKEPEDFSDQNALLTYLQCLDQQCAEGSCNVVFGEPVCLKQCTMSAADDAVNNINGDAVPDGVEDGDSLCAGAAPAGPYGDAYKCVRVTNPQAGQQDFTQCTAGTDFKSCTVSSDCPVGEACKIHTILGITDFYCGTAIAGGKGASEFCENNPHNPAIFYNADLAYCTEGLCFGIGIGCSAACGSDDSLCFPEGVGCTDGSCDNNAAASCENATDCSPWFCEQDFLLSSGPPELRAGTCFGKNCDINDDCVDPNFFCRTFYNGEDTPELADWDHICLRKPDNSVPVGAACDFNSNDDFPGDVCENPIWCTNGMCSTHCLSDTDCAAGKQICGVETFPIDLNDNEFYGDAGDAFMSLNVCQPIKHEGDLTECGGDSDCTVPGEFCTPTQVDAAAGGAEFKFYCTSSENAAVTGDHGDKCGADTGNWCVNGMCLNFYTSGDGETVPSCFSVCSSTADCPVDVEMLNGEAANASGVCQAIRFSSNGSADVKDDLYVSICRPEDPASSLSDCGTATAGVGDTSVCDAASETCYATAIASNPDVAATVEFLCMSNLDSNGAQASKLPGQSCEAYYECKSLLCEQTAAGGVCSTFCDPADATSCSDVPGTGCLAQVAIPREDPALSASLYKCLPLDSTCIPCEVHTDCQSGYVCSNTGTQLNQNFRCVADCAATGTCDSGSCGNVVDGLGLPAEGCSTSCN